MKRRMCLITALVVVTLLLGCSNTTAITTQNTHAKGQEKTIEETKIHTSIEEISKNFIQAFIEKNFQKMRSQFALTKEMQDALTIETLQYLYDSLLKVAGRPLNIIDYSLKTVDNYDVASVAVEHEHKKINHDITFDKDNNIVGYYYSNYKEKQSSIYKTEDVTFGKKPYIINGTITYPKGEGPFPVVVLVHGSGPHDRDETIFKNKPFRDIAQGLAEKGIATLRYDKRTYTYTKALHRLQSDNMFTIYDEVVDDAVYAVEYLKQKTTVKQDKIFVLGHSLGANQAPRIIKNTQGIAGLILMAGNVTPLQVLIVNQIEYLSQLDGVVTNQEKQEIESVKILRDTLSSPTYSKDVPANKTLNISYHYWKDIINYNPTDILKTLNIPTLILQGERDYQVTMTEFKKWQEALGNGATYISYPKLNHLFIEGEGTPSLEEYKKAGQVDKKVIADIATFIKKR